LKHPCVVIFLQMYILASETAHLLLHVAGTVTTHTADIQGDQKVSVSDEYSIDLCCGYGATTLSAPKLAGPLFVAI
jgi:hypothetical protein